MLITKVIKVIFINFPTDFVAHFVKKNILNDLGLHGVTETFGLLNTGKCKKLAEIAAYKVDAYCYNRRHNITAGITSKSSGHA